MKSLNEIHHKKKGEKGVALLFVISSVAILAALLADFTFETKLNQLQVYNAVDKVQAKLHARSGLQMALARLRFYKEALNKVAQDKNLKDKVKPADLNTIWQVLNPIIMPLPSIPNASALQKSAIEEFHKELLIAEDAPTDDPSYFNIRTEIQNISHLMNINLLRISGTNDEDSSSSEQDEKSKSIRQEMAQLINTIIDSRKETDEDFANKFANVEVNDLVDELRFYISDQRVATNGNFAEAQALYENSDITPKYAPLQSKTELYNLVGWEEEIVDLLYDSFTVHGVVAIDLNKADQRMMKFLFPEMTDDQLKLFFEYRDDPESKKDFNDIEEFKTYMTSTEAIVTTAAFDERMKNLGTAGIQFGVTGTLFRVISTGKQGRAEVTIEAIIEIPPEPVIEQKKTDDNTAQSKTTNPDAVDTTDPANSTSTSGQKTEEKAPTIYMEPRIVEIIIS